MKKGQSGLLRRELFPVAAPRFHDLAGTEREGEGTADFPFHQCVDAGGQGEALAGTMTGGETTTVRGQKGAAVLIGQRSGDGNTTNVFEEKSMQGEELGESFPGRKNPVEIERCQAHRIDPEAGVPLAAASAAGAAHLGVEGERFHIRVNLLDQSRSGN